MLGTQPPAPSRESTQTTITDLDALQERPAVPTRTQTLLHGSVDHCATDIAGRAVVGTVDDHGRLLVGHRTDPTVSMLPHGDVEEKGDDWAAAGRAGVADRLGVDVEIRDVVLVREIDHVVVDDDLLLADVGDRLREDRPADVEPQVTTRNVLLRAQPVEERRSPNSRDRASADDASDAEAWQPRWVTALPNDAAPGMPEADIRRFLE